MVATAVEAGYSGGTSDTDSQGDGAMRATQWAVMAILLAASPARSQTAPPPAADPDPAGLVRRLGSPSFAAREAAEKQLKALGTAALPAVTAGAADPDPEISRRCAGIRQHIREAEAQAFV